MTHWSDGKYWSEGKHGVALLARLALSAVWVIAGGLKVADPAASAGAVQAYQIPGLGGSLAENIGYLLPPLELVIGIALLVGILTRGAAIVSALLLVAYIAGIASVWARGITIDCGCFGGGGYDPNASDKYPYEIARDLGFLVLAALVVHVGPTRLALDSLLFRRTPVPAAEAALTEGD